MLNKVKNLYKKLRETKIDTYTKGYIIFTLIIAVGVSVYLGIKNLFVEAYSMLILNVVVIVTIYLWLVLIDTKNISENVEEQGWFEKIEIYILKIVNFLPISLLFALQLGTVTYYEKIDNSIISYISIIIVGIIFMILLLYRGIAYIVFGGIIYILGLLSPTMLPAIAFMTAIVATIFSYSDLSKLKENIDDEKTIIKIKYNQVVFLIVLTIVYITIEITNTLFSNSFLMEYERFLKAVIRVLIIMFVYLMYEKYKGKLYIYFSEYLHSLIVLKSQKEKNKQKK